MKNLNLGANSNTMPDFSLFNLDFAQLKSSLYSK